MTDFDAGDVSKYFEPGQECSVLGLRLVWDPELAAKRFSEYRRSHRPQVFVADFGNAAERLAMGAAEMIAAGDALWHIGGQPARCKEMYIHGIPSFVEALVTMHSPHTHTPCYWRTQAGHIVTAPVRVSSADLPELTALRDALRAHARSAGLPWKTPKRYYEGAFYPLLVLKDWLWPEKFIIEEEDGSTGVLKRKRALHWQFLYELMANVCQRAPCEAVIRIGPGGVSIDETRGEGADPALPLIGDVMKTARCGSVWWLRRAMRKLVGEITCEVDDDKTLVNVTRDNDDTFHMCAERAAAADH